MKYCKTARDMTDARDMLEIIVFCPLHTQSTSNHLPIARKEVVLSLKLMKKIKEHKRCIYELAYKLAQQS